MNTLRAILRATLLIVGGGGLLVAIWLGYDYAMQARYLRCAAPNAIPYRARIIEKKFGGFGAEGWRVIHFQVDESRFHRMLASRIYTEVKLGRPIEGYTPTNEFLLGDDTENRTLLGIHTPANRVLALDNVPTVVQWWQATEGDFVAMLGKTDEPSYYVAICGY